MLVYRVLRDISQHKGTIPGPQSPAPIAVELSEAVEGSHSFSVPPRNFLGTDPKYILQTDAHTLPRWEPRDVWDTLTRFPLKESDKEGCPPRLLTPQKCKDLVLQCGDLCPP